MNKKEETYFLALSEDRSEIANVLDRRAVRGYKDSVVEKYSDQAHFIYELLQNADDACATRARFILEENRLIFAHNGSRHFSVSNPANEDVDSENKTLGDINAITSIANSNKTGASIGKFGVGFKAVFQYTQTPYIYDPNFRFNNDITFRGRVLKHIPQNKFEELQEATDIAVEKEFRIPETCELFMCGTLYNRYEPYWREFTGGRQYEKRGHYHAAVFGEGFKDIHETFHVRDIMTEATVSFEIECFPVDKVYRIYPVVFKNNQYVISSFEESVDAFAEKFNNSASKL